jgi:hypothetical protein
MKIPRLFTLLWGLVLFIPAFSQSVFHFSFSGTGQGDTTSCRAFFQRYDNGMGIVRVKYFTADTKELVLLETTMEEQSLINSKGMVEDGVVFYKERSRAVITENTNVKYLSPRFWFKLNSRTNQYEPWSVTDSTVTQIPSTSNVATVFLENQEKIRAIASDFYYPDEQFFKSLSEIGTRGPVDAKTTLILRIVSNINDKYIGASCEKDMNDMVEHFRYVTNVLGIKYDYETIAGKLYSKENIQKEINAINPVKNTDIVVFYYSGHGFRKPYQDSLPPNKKRNFPYLDFREENDNTYLVNSMNVEDIFNQLRNKGARLTLVFSDCCNSKVDATNVIATSIPPGKKSGLNWSQENCKALFMNENGPRAILMTAADVGQRAASNPTFGGFFSYFLRTSMDAYLSQGMKVSMVSWDRVLENTKTETYKKARRTYCAEPEIPENICDHTPMYIKR